MAGMHAGPPDLDHAVTHVIERTQIELLIGVEAADASRRACRENTAGADHLHRAAVPDEQVLAVRIEAVDVQTGHRRLDPRPVLLDKDAPPQVLGLRDVLRRARPGHIKRSRTPAVRRVVLPQHAGSPFRRRISARLGRVDDGSAMVG